MTTSTFRIGGVREVGRLGFGAMHLTTAPGPARDRSIAVARRAVELGVTLIDTAHLYGWGANEDLLAEALHPYPAEVLIATKVGVAPPDGVRETRYCGSAEFLRSQVDEGLRRLKVDRLELLQLHRIDPGVPIADQVGTLRELQEEGKIGHLGLSEVTVEELAEARRHATIATVQNRYSIVDREHEAVLDACAEAGIGFLPWRPVLPGASAGGEIAAVAAEVGATAAQVSLAWLLTRAPVVLPIPGTGSLDHLAENVAAAEVRLSAEQLARLGSAGLS
ncbi:aldo/keto reductase [Actinoplanes sp. NBRC 103695]|uniref:aldo/keto reductase n=1 Tax=Actinoplanes sp. NBRC 103695 TaxID=3032202 RepID=UPI0024A06F4D|nr:aldo/keto reductase [Actinoplanes sp. NBRC 103695]GLZ00718.1 oxidoreductase [Actinoplanes sp. NBRC 103695]